MTHPPAKAIQSLRKLRKQIKKSPRQPSPKQVHDLRTQSRQVEAIAHAYRLNRKRKGRRLLKALEPVRKIAGKVRDMDVLIGFAAALPGNGEEQCFIQLLEHLGAQRAKSARKLRKTIAAHRKQALQHLKHCSKSIEKQFSRTTKPITTEPDLSADTIASALEIWTELSRWPRLNAATLHPFRLKVKELRYILQLAKNDNGNFVQALGQVKDSIGEWHDWNELATIAAGVLHHGTRCSLIKQIRSITKAKLSDALSATNRMREKYQHAGTGRNRILSDPAAG